MKENCLIILSLLLSLMCGCSDTVIENEIMGDATTKLIGETILHKEDILAEIEKMESLHPMKIGGSPVHTQIFRNIDKEKNINIQIQYPQITEMKDITKQHNINEIIEESALRPYHKLFDIEGIPDDDTEWLVEYSIEYSTLDIVSIKFQGYVYTQGNAHGIDWVYTVNIDLNTGKKITTAELFDGAFKERLNHSVFKGVDTDTSNADPGAMEELFSRFRSDFENSDDNFYFTPEDFIIILPISNFFRFSARYDDLKSCMKSNSEIWHSILDLNDTE